MPRAGVTRERVIDEAMAVVDTTGFDRLTLAALADRLGVRLPSLYKHVDGLDAVRADVAARSKQELGDVLARAAVGRAGRDALEAMGRAYRAWGKAHPGRYDATLRAPDRSSADEVASATRVAEVVFDVLVHLGLGKDDLVDATRFLRAGLHGFVSLELHGGFGLPDDVDRSFDRTLDGIVTAIEGFVPARPRGGRGGRG